MNKLNLRTFRLATGLGLLLLLQLPAGFGLAEDAGDAAARVGRLATLLQDREGDRFWSLVSRIEEIGEAAVPALKKQLSAENEKTRLGCAKALLGLGDTAARREALVVLGNLAAKSGGKEVRIDAIRIYGLVADPDEILDRLSGQLETEADPAILIALASCLWDVDNLPAARDKLLSLLGSRNTGVSQEAALALAEAGNFGDGRIKTALRKLRKEPTPRGRRAELLYRLMKLETQLDQGLFKGTTVPAGTDMKKLLAKKEERISELEARLKKMENTGGLAGGGTQARGDRLLE